MKKIDLKRFKQIIKTIQDHEKDSDKLTKIMVKSSVGIIDYGFDITAELVKLLEFIFEDEGEWISWWLYENVDKIATWKNIKYDLNKIEDLYYWICKDYEKVKHETMESN